MVPLWISEYRCRTRPCVQKSSKGLGIPLSSVYNHSSKLLQVPLEEGLGHITGTIAVAFQGSFSEAPSHLFSPYVLDLHLKIGSSLRTEKGIKTFLLGECC